MVSLGIHQFARAGLYGVTGPGAHVVSHCFKSPYPTALQSKLTKPICSTVLQLMSASAGLPTSRAMQRAREIATLSRFLLYKNSMWRGMLSLLEVARFLYPDRSGPAQYGAGSLERRQRQTQSSESGERFCARDFLRFFRATGKAFGVDSEITPKRGGLASPAYGYFAALS